MPTEIIEKPLDPSSALKANDYASGTLARARNGGLYVCACRYEDKATPAWVLITDTAKDTPYVYLNVIHGYLVTLESATVVRK